MGAKRVLAVVVSSFLGAVAVSGCGGGGGGGSSALPPTLAGPASPAIPGATATPTAVPASVAFTIAIPAVTPSATRRSPRYISPGTKSARISAGATSQTTDCTTQCNLTLQVFAGTQTFAATLYDGPGGTGNVLSTGQTTATIVAGKSNLVMITFGGVAAKLSLALDTTRLTVGTTGSAGVLVSAQDAAGYTIVGPDAFANPIALASDDTSGATTLSTTSVTTPGTAVSLAYSGRGGPATITLTASAVGVASATATLALVPAPTPTPSPTATPAPTATPTPSPSPGSFPTHIRSEVYYGLNGVNADIPAAYMAQNVTIVEDDGYTAAHADAFKRAGGAIALAYTDPTYAYDCAGPVTSPAGPCTGQVGRFISDEGAYFHDASGARVGRNTNSTFGYEEVLNPANANARAAYAQAAAAVSAVSPLLDGYLADDSGSPFSTPGGSLGSDLFGYFSTSGVEIGSDAAYVSAFSQMLAAAGKPVMVNGGDPTTWGPAYGGTFVDLPAVMGQLFEGCFNNGGNYLYTDAGNTFVREEDGLLAVIAHHKLADCLPTGDTSAAHRLYAYAAFLLSYDPQYSVFAMETTQSDGRALYPETQLVPQLPRMTAGEIGQLRTGANTYVREFGACAIGGNPIGPCAAVVNASSTASATLPSLATTYGSSIGLDAASLYGGGRARVVAGVPASLPPATAAILVH